LKKFIFILLAVSTSHALLADSKKLETINVTASRISQPDGEALAPLTVFTREDIERLQPNDLPDLLNRIPGLDIRKNGGVGSTTGLFIRGTSNSNLLTLVNGTRVGSATNGATALEYLDVSQIERIELVRGPRSSLYGPDAIGGVLQLFTKTGSNTLIPEVSYSYGKNRTQKTAANISGSTGNWLYSVGNTYYETLGIDNLINDDGFNDDKDAYRNNTSTGSIGQEWSTGSKWRLSHYQSEGKNEFDDAYAPDSQPKTDFREKVTSLETDIVINKLWKVSGIVGHSEDTQNGNDKQDPNNSFNYANDTYQTKRDSASLLNHLTIAGRDTLSIGYDYMHDAINVTNAYNKDTKHNDGVFAQYQMNLDSHKISASIRQDDDSAYGNQSTGNIAWRINLPADLYIITSYGTGFRAPNFNELYSPWGGNKNLSPEESANSEVELGGAYSSGNWAINAYHNRIDDLIAYNDFFTPENINKADIQGVEFSNTLNYGNLVINTNATYIEARDDNTNELLIRRPRTAFNFDIDHALGKWELGASWRLRGKAQDTDFSSGNDVTISGFGTIDLRSKYHLTNELKLEFSLENILDQNDQTVYGYYGQGFTYMTGIRYTPE
jgi:vitamin B12 transporter